MLVRIKRQKGPNENSYWQSFEYNGSLDATVVTVINSINYTDDIYDIEGNHAERIRWECSCMQGVCGGCDAWCYNSKLRYGAPCGQNLSDGAYHARQGRGGTALAYG
jgi:succinate dehydrogenase/fumarate reductase-like Fe-S protein